MNEEKKRENEEKGAAITEEKVNLGEITGSHVVSQFKVCIKIAHA
jgi:hypothetical protein